MPLMSTDERVLLRDSVRRFVEKNYGFEQRRALAAQAPGFSREHWATYAELGWLALAIPEAAGGLGGSMAETGIVLEEFGRGLVLEPYLPVAVFATELVKQAGSPEQQAALLAPVGAGESMLAVAHGEPEARGRVAHVATTAEKRGDSWVLDGLKSLVVPGPASDRFIVSARIDGAVGNTDGIALFIVPSETDGLIRRSYRTIDGSRASELRLDHVRVGAAAVLGAPGRAYPAIATAVAVATIGICAEAVGAMDAALWITRDYLRTRQQFGVAISSFQSLQHRAADMLVELELARSMVQRGIDSLEGLAPDERDDTVAAVKAQIGRSSKFVAAQSIQLHGGIGVTEEYVIGHYFKRLTVIEATFGNTAFHLNRIADALRNEARSAA